MNTIETIQSIVPAALALEPATTVSGKYKFYSTRDVVEQFMEQGFILTGSSQSNVRKKEYQGFQRHQVVLDFPIDHGGGGHKVGDYKFQARIVNSHCGSAALTVHLGVHVLICSNGMVASESAQAFRLVHRSDKRDVMVVMEELLKQSERSTLLIGKMCATKITYEDQLRMAEYAIGLRWPTFGPGWTKAFNHVNLMINRRPEQAEGNVWNTLNTIQERTIRGFKYYDEGKQKMRKVRPIKSITRDVSINRKLWEHALTYV